MGRRFGSPSGSSGLRGGRGAHLRAGTRTGHAARRDGEKPGPQPHPEHRHLGGQRLAQQSEFGTTCGKAVIAVRGHGAAHHDQRLDAGQALRQRIPRPHPADPQPQPGRHQCLAERVGPLGPHMLHHQYSRPGAASRSAVVAPLVHSRPKLAGWALSPDALRIFRRPSAPVATSSTIPQPTPQYEHTVRTCSARPRGS